MSLFLGVDIGTTAIKGIIVSSDGTVVATHYARRSGLTADLSRHPDDPVNLWHGFKHTIQNLLSSAPHAASSLVSIAISGIIPNICLLNSDDGVHQPILRYSDRCAFDIEVQLDGELKNGKWQNEVLSKLIWAKRASTTKKAINLKLFSPHTWITYRLTGNYVMDWVSAIEHGCIFDTKEKSWNNALLRNYGIDFIVWPVRVK